ncbi:hypothetical protein QEH52_03355 [Coraliomargarita sp. SDUM461003]|uniref:PEP-CTERM protein-sorting domain-containing protein n=1 Tax=Thalassobacterium maritimum TaxID=3041265 RepID=A0ABU1AQV6_9BACT|nr:hypothetical protein [Coraliomargarita sp. SDUM461003]MDQ8206530.1 hypothetical protein [Coraliomargarita sp. SDUM461003]
MKLTQTFFTAAAISCFAFSASGSVTFDPTGNSAYDGLATINESLTDTDNGFNTTITLTAGGGTFNSNSGDFGIDSGTGTNDFIDGTSESITITFSTDILFNFIDLSEVGSDATDGAKLTIGGSSINLFTGVTGFNGTQDIYTPTSPIALSSGDSIILTGSEATSEFTLEGINITVVPEPGTFALLSGFSALTFVMLRRRSA